MKLCATFLLGGAVASVLGLALPVFATSAESAEGLRRLNNAALYFEGGSENGVFRARGCNYDFLVSPAELGIWLSKTQKREAVGKRGLAEQGQVTMRGLRVTFPGSNPQPRIGGEKPGLARVNYLYGSDPSQWRRGVGTFGSVRVQELYPGVDVVYYGNQQRLEYDFEVAPGANPSVIRVLFDGVDSLQIGDSGNLVMRLGDETLEQPKPVFYQLIKGMRRSVDGGFVLVDDKTIGFEIGPYDREYPLVLDPILSYSSFFGGNEGDVALAVKLDPQGNIYVGGQTLSTRLTVDVPPGGFQPNFGGGSKNGDAYVAKFAPNGALLYFTYLGGNGNDGALDLAVDQLGQVRVAGFTDSPNFPTRNAVYPTIGGGKLPTGVYYSDAFVSQLNASGSDLVFSTYMGGSGIDSADAVATDSQGNTYVGGYTYSTNFPVTAGALANAQQNLGRFQGGVQDAFVAKLGPGGSTLMYSSYLGGTNTDEVQGIAADALGQAYVTGYTSSTNFPVVNAFRTNLNGWPKLPLLKDAFVAKISPLGNAFLYSTYLGGTNDDAGFRIALDGNGAAFVTGSTLSRDFPNTATNIPGLKVGFTGSSPSSGDTFLTKLNPDGELTTFSSRFGGPQEDVGWDIALDADGNVFIVGTTSSYTDFPLFAAEDWPVPNKDRGKDPIVFVTAFNAEGTALFYSLIFGGQKSDYGYGIAADPAGNAYVVGRTTSPDFPLASPLQNTTSDKNDAFLSKITLEPTLTSVPAVSGVTIRWRAFSPEYGLESSHPQEAGATWVPVPQSPEIKGGWHELSLPTSDSSSLFRLRRAE